MTSISTFIQLLPQKFDDREFRHEFYQVAREETDRVNNLINELLDLVKTRKSNFEQVDLHDLIEKRILLISAQSNPKRIRIECHFDPLIENVWLDPEKMKQTVLNILSNAVTYTPERGTIEIDTKLKDGPENQQQIIMEITDSGPGIPPEIADRIFDPYFTTRHKSSMFNGTGLGLFIAYQNIQDHGGDIDVTQKQGMGASFRISLPVKHKQS
jgi:signal transduction histidine kinase